MANLTRKLNLLILYSFATLMLSSSRALPDDAGQIFQEGLLQEYGTGDLNKAIELYEKALQSDNMDEELASRALLRLGICYEKLGRYVDAKKVYQQIISRFAQQIIIRNDAADRLEKLSSGLVTAGHWFRYKGEYIYLLCAGTASIYAGSGLGSANGITNDPVRDWKAYIDLLTRHGVNLVRFHPWDFLNHSEVPDYACPWVITDDKPTYALKSFNRRYWAKLREIISYASSKDIFFIIVLFDDDSPWDRHPFNNSCGGALESLAEYHNLENAGNRSYQESYVRKTIDETVEYPNVIYEICDAVGWQGKVVSQKMKDWISHWITFIDEILPATSNHLITVSQNSWSSGGELDTLWNLPGIDIISAQETKGTEFALGKEYTHNQFLKYWKTGYGKPMIINEANFGDIMGHPKGGTRGWVEERQHLWVAFASGGHAARSDFQPFNITYPSMTSCLHLSNFVGQIKFWKMTPLAEFVAHCDGTYYSIGSNEEYVVYIKSRASKKGAMIKLELPGSDYEANWYDPVQGEFIPELKSEVSGGTFTLNLPEMANDMALYIREVGER